MKKFLAGLLVAVALALAPVAAVAVEKPDILEVETFTGEVSDAWAVRLDTLREQFASQPNVKGLLLVIDSPGGGVLATQAVYDALAKIKLPVIVWCDNVCASGGIYIAMSPSVKYLAMRDISITGSVGVRMTALRVNRLLDWAKVDVKTYKSGALKDSGDPTRAENEADAAYLQGIVDKLASKFYGVVVKGRPKVQIDVLKDARIVFGDDAVKIGLADATMDKDDAIKKAKELSGAKFTREDLKKMAKAAEAPSQYNAPSLEPNVLNSIARTLDEALKAYKSIKQGGTEITVEYRMPVMF